MVSSSRQGYTESKYVGGVVPQILLLHFPRFGSGLELYPSHSDEGD